MNSFFRIELAYHDLANEIVQQLPEELFKSSSTTFLDPAFAGGQFILAIAHRLHKYGHSIDNIKSRIFGYERSVVYKNYPTNKKLDFISNLSIIPYNEFFSKTPNMNFDVVVGNPPFKGNGKTPLYAKFHNKGMEVLKPNGLLALISPTAIATAFEKGHIGPKTKVTVGELELLNMDDRIKTDYFSGVGSTFCYYIMRNKVSSGDDYKVIFGNGQEEITKVNVLTISASNPITRSIISKAFSYKANPYNAVWCCAGTSVTVGSGDSKVVDAINADGTLDTIPAVTERHKFAGRPKVFVAAFGNRAVVNYDYEIVAGNKNMIVTVPTDSDEQGERLVHLLNCNLQLFLNKILGRGERTAFLFHFKGVPLDRYWTNDELYQYFNLTDEEINHITETI